MRALRGLVLTYESQRHLRRYAPYKGLRPLRRFAAIPFPVSLLYKWAVLQVIHLLRV